MFAITEGRGDVCGPWDGREESTRPHHAQGPGSLQMTTNRRIIDNWKEVCFSQGA